MARENLLDRKSFSSLRYTRKLSYMDTALPRIGILPNRLWPIPASDGHAESVFIDEPLLRILLEVFTGSSRSPLHIYTHADRFMYVAEGEITFVTYKTCTRLPSGESVIIRADHPHGFVVGERGAKLISISLGYGAQEGKSRLPNHISQQFAPLRDKASRIGAFEHETRWKNLYSQFEVQTMQWVKQTMLDSLKAGRPLPFDLEPNKHVSAIPMQGWKTPSAFILKVKGYSYGFSYHSEYGNEYISV